MGGQPHLGSGAAQSPGQRGIGLGGVPAPRVEPPDAGHPDGIVGHKIAASDDLRHQRGHAADADHPFRAQMRQLDQRDLGRWPADATAADAQGIALIAPSDQRELALPTKILNVFEHVPQQGNAVRVAGHQHVGSHVPGTAGQMRRGVRR